ncbi:MAG TPA: universal stress protein, partial [Acidimicrobiia bacterium]|nr:universal stress protein [Acidimicrobiia bacterium]
MSYSTVVIVGAACWLSIGLTLSLVMGRRGHDAFAWLILGTLFGPLGAIFAVEARGEERPRPELIAERRSAGPGPVDLLVGV